MYILTDGKVYIGTDSCNSAMVVSTIDKALVFANEKKAINYKKNLKAIMQKYDWRVVRRMSPVEEFVEKEKTKGEEQNSICYEYKKTQLEQIGFDIVDFFGNAIETISQLSDYANNMEYLEKEYNQKILDIRHYKRDKNTKLNALQLQKLERFEIQLERERYECKSNAIIAKIFLADMSRLGNTEYLEVIRNVKESEYVPKILTYELLDEIVGKKRKEKS